MFNNRDYTDPLKSNKPGSLEVFIGPKTLVRPETSAGLLIPQDPDAN